MHLEICFPHLESLSLGFNRIGTLYLAESDEQVVFPYLKYLTLENNLIMDWNEVMNLSSLPKYFRCALKK